MFLKCNNHTDKQNNNLILNLKTSDNRFFIFMKISWVQLRDIESWFRLKLTTVVMVCETSFLSKPLRYSFEILWAYISTAQGGKYWVPDEDWPHYNRNYLWNKVTNHWSSMGCFNNYLTKLNFVWHKASYLKQQVRIGLTAVVMIFEIRLLTLAMQQ